MIAELFVMPMAFMAEGVNLTPSSRRVTGASKKNDMMVIILKRLMLSSLTAPYTHAVARYVSSCWACSEKLASPSL